MANVIMQTGNELDWNARKGKHDENTKMWRKILESRQGQRQSFNNNNKMGPKSLEIEDHKLWLVGHNMSHLGPLILFQNWAPPPTQPLFIASILVYRRKLTPRLRVQVFFFLILYNILI